MKCDSTAPSSLPAGLIVFSSDGRAQFGWRHPQTGELHAEDNGNVISNPLGAIAWIPGLMH